MEEVAAPFLRSVLRVERGGGGGGSRNEENGAAAAADAQEKSTRLFCLPCILDLYHSPSAPVYLSSSESCRE